MDSDYKSGALRQRSVSTTRKFTVRSWGSTNPRLRSFKPMVWSKLKQSVLQIGTPKNCRKNMTNKNSAENKINPENVTTDELQDPMSGYTIADALSANDAP